MRQAIFRIIFFSFPFMVLLLLFSGCENVFTFSTFESFGHDPDEMTLEEKIEYAKQALASGDEEYMEKAYDALLEETTDNPEVHLLLGRLAVELSGFTELLFAIADDDNDLQLSSEPDEEALSDFIDELSETYLDAVESEYTLADTLAADMNATDYIFAGLSVIFSEINEYGELSDFTNLSIDTYGYEESADIDDIEAQINLYTPAYLATLSDEDLEAIREDLVGYKEDLQEIKPQLQDMKERLESGSIFTEIDNVISAIDDSAYFIDKAIDSLSDGVVKDGLEGFNDYLDDLRQEIVDARSEITANITSMIDDIDAALAEIDPLISDIDDLIDQIDFFLGS